MVAQPAGALLMLANLSAERLKMNTPPVRPCASRATQKPSALRPMKNNGMDSLRASLFGRRGKTAPLVPFVLPLKEKLMIVSHAALHAVVTC